MQPRPSTELPVLLVRYVLALVVLFTIVGGAFVPTEVWSPNPSQQFVPQQPQLAEALSQPGKHEAYQLLLSALVSNRSIIVETKGALGAESATVCEGMLMLSRGLLYTQTTTTCL